MRYLKENFNPKTSFHFFYKIIFIGVKIYLIQLLFYIVIGIILYFMDNVNLFYMMRNNIPVLYCFPMKPFFLTRSDGGGGEVHQK